MPTVAEWFLRGVIAHGCETIFLNPGTDTPPLQEAYAKLAQAGERVPELIVCPHEIIAVTAAQGHYLASRKPQVAFVHVDVGTANAAGGLNDARASQIPVILCAGTSPSTLDSRIPGARTKFINWQQDVPDQQALVRNYVKWSMSVAHAGAIGPAIDRAFQIARSDPAGPVYLSFPRETLMEEVEDSGMRGPARSKPMKLPGLMPDATRTIVDDILRADFPVLVTGYGGRTKETRELLVSLADTLALPITEYRGRFNAPLQHHLHLGFNPERWVGEADLILVVDHDVPFVPADRKLRDGAKVVHIGPDPIKQSMVVWGFPADEVYPCGLQVGLEALVRAAADGVRRLSEDDRETLQRRRERIQALHAKLMSEIDAESPGQTRRNVITPFMIGQTLSELCPEAQLYEEAVTSGNPIAYGFRPSAEGAYMRNGGTFLGWGLGASLGAKLANKDRLVVTVVGDGSFLFGVPSAALSASKRYGLPLLIIVVNNNAYNSVRLAARDAYPDGVQARNGYVGTELADLPAFDKLAEACGAWGCKVENIGDLRPRLEQALETVRRGRTAVVDVMIEAADKPL